ncbi:hypothetical protein [uncultured Aquimarina sp.]|uniref:hypothetical protein n=1 Tax=uncultured Aquimarina sp. TaxID=575652 RepID=UPI00260FEEC6|nr:hypothetical protein [uncultured Aquimarina sp.]
MTYSKILILSILCIMSASAEIYAQKSLSNPSLSAKKSTKTLIIDSIPVIKSENYSLKGINNGTNDYRLFLGLSRISDYPSFGISRTRPYLVIRNNAFTHKSLFDPVVNISLQQQSWDNPLGSDSFGVGVIAGSLQLISNVFKK